MPKRTNEFQKIVFLVKKHAADGATVTESKMYTDRATGDSREVDIVIELTVMNHPTVISIECTDTSRRADVGWVERMKCKHDRLQTNTLVLMSRRGFTPAARKVAEFYNIETVAFDEMNETTLETLVGTNGSLWWKSITLTPTKVIATIHREDVEEPVSVVLENDYAICDANGEEMGSALELVHWILNERGAAKDLLQSGDRSHKGFNVTWGPWTDSDGKSILFLQNLERHCFDRIESVYFEGMCGVEAVELSLKSAKLGNESIAFGRAKIFEKDVLLVASGKKLSITTEPVT